MGMWRSSNPSGLTDAVWSSQGSRTSSTTGTTPGAWAPACCNQSWSWAGWIEIMASELEARRFGEVAQPRGHGVPGLGGDVRSVAGARDEGGAHDRLVADDGVQPATRGPQRGPGGRDLGDRAAGQ